MAPTVLERRRMAPPATVLPRRRPLWSAVAAVLICVGLYDGGVMTFGPVHYFSSASYAGVRAIGLRPVGVAALVISCTFLYLLHSGDRRWLQAVCVVGFGYELFWLTALLWSWRSVGIVGLTGPSKAAALAALYAVLAWHIDERRGT